LNITTKSILLSALVYPGSGHYYLNKKRSAIILACAFTLPLVFLFNEIFQIAQTIAGQINSGRLSLDLYDIKQQLTIELESLNNYYKVSLFAIWVIGVVDSYRIARNAT